MSRPKEIWVRYRFVKVRRHPSSELERFAQMAHQLVQATPWLVPKLPFGATSCVRGGLLEAFPSGAELTGVSPDMSEEAKLKAIESSTGTLLEHIYDAEGALIETIYPDGIRTKYRRNDDGKIARVDLTAQESILFKYGRRGLLETVAYPGGSQFQYEYGPEGRLLKCQYPDGGSGWRKYDRHGRIVEALVGQLRFNYDRNGDGILRRVIFSGAGETRDFVVLKDQISVKMTPCHVHGDTETEVLSALGAWMYSSDGRLRDMLLPDGERLSVRAIARGAGEHVWTSLGQATYLYDKDRILSAVIYPNGMRSVYYRIPETRNVFAVSPVGVAVYQYDLRGRLCKIRCDTGQYALFGHDRNGRANSSTTAQGTMRMHHDYRGRLDRIGFPTGSRATISYGSAAYPIAIELSKIAPDAWSAALRFGDALWQWVGLKSTLRLEDPPSQEI